jgi:hypothetical protein
MIISRAESFTYGKPLCAVQNINTKASVSAQKHRGAFGGGLVSYLRYLYFFAHSDVQLILCCAFILHKILLF